MIPGFENVYVLTGPTGSGKTALSLTLAGRLNAEIVSMDSMALYRGMDIGTAKPSAADRGRAPFHLIDVLDPWESSNVAWWLEQAQACCRGLAEKGKQALVVGGTPLYLKAMLYGIFEGPAVDSSLRSHLEAETASLSPAELHGRLAAVDPVAAERLHPHDRRRILRALEVFQATGRPLSTWQKQWTDEPEGNTPPPIGRVVYLDWPRAELYARIDRRVVQMVDEGWAEEADRLRRLPQPLSREAGQALGYQEMFDYLEGKFSLADAIKLIQTRSRQFAKRQLTWFRNLTGCLALKPEEAAAVWMR